MKNTRHNRWLITVAAALALCVSLLFSACGTELFRIAFVANGEELYVQQIEDGSEFSVPELTSVKAEDENYTYTFLGWCPSAEKEIIIYDEGIPFDMYIAGMPLTVTGSITFCPVYKADRKSTYTVTLFDGQTEEQIGGSLHVMSGEAFELPAAPVHEGYTFTGWEIEGETALKQAGEKVTIVRRTDITARYSLNSYTLTLYYLDRTETKQVAYGADLSAEAPEAIEGLIFDGWIIAKTGGAQDPAPETMPAANLELAATYSIDWNGAALSLAGDNVYGGGDDLISVQNLPAGEDFSYTYEWEGVTADGASVLVKTVGEMQLSCTVKASYKNLVKGETTLTLTADLQAAELTATVSLEKDSIVYGETPAPSVAFDGFCYDDSEEDVAVTYSYLANGSPESGRLSVGEYSVTAEIDAEFANYILSVEPATLTVTQKEITVTASIAPSIVYGETPAPTVSFSGLVEGDEVEGLFSSAEQFIYEKDGEPYNAPFVEGGSYRYVAGSYTVQADDYTAVNYIVKKGAAAAFEITKKPIELTVTATSTFVYGEQPTWNVTKTGGEYAYNDNVGDIHYTVTCKKGDETVEVQEFLDVGNYTLELAASSENYSDNYEVTAHNGSFEVTPRPITLKISTVKTEYSYGESLDRTRNWLNVKGPKPQNTDEDLIGQLLEDVYTRNGKPYDFKSERMYVDVGTYTLSVNAEGGVHGNYDITIEDAHFTVNKQVFALGETVSQWSRDTKYEYHPSFGEDKPEFKFEGTVVLRDTNEGTRIAQNEEDFNKYFKWESGPHIKLQTTTTTIFDVTENFTFTYNFNITLSKSNFSVTEPQKKSYVYDGAEHDFSVVVTPVAGEEVDYTVSYKLDSADAYSAAAPKFTNVGKHTVEYRVSANNYADTTGSYEVSITKKADNQISLSGEHADFTYNGAEHTFNITATAAFGTVTATLNGTQQLTAKENVFTFTAKNVGTYTVTFTVADTDNYNGDTQSVTVNVGKAESNTIAVGGEHADFTYDGTEHELTVTASATFGEVKAACTGDIAVTSDGGIFKLSLKNAGEYTVTLTVDGTENFVGASTTVTINVEKAELTAAWTVDEKTYSPDKTYNEAELCTVSGVKGTDGNVYTWSYTYAGNGSEGSIHDAGTYTLKLTLNNTDNYRFADGAEMQKTFVIKKAAAQTATAPTVGEQINRYGFTLQEIVLGDNWHWVTPGAELVAGEQSYQAVYNPDPVNYEDHIESITFKTTKTKLLLTFSQAVRDSGIEVEYSEWEAKTPEQFAGSYTLVAKNRSDLDIKAQDGEFGYLQKLWEGGPILLETPFADGKIYGGTYLLLYSFSLDENPYYEWAEGQDPTELNSKLLLKIKSVEWNGALYTMEEALAAADSGSIIVKYNTTFASKAAAEVAGYTTEGGHYTVKNGVTLKLPYDGTSTYGSPGKNATGTSTLSFGDASKQKLLMTVPENIILYNNGKIEVGGYVTGSGGGNLAGQTTENYARIDLGSNAKIESHGDIDVYGFITESTWNNGAEVVMQSGTMKMPFVVVEFRGGSTFSNIGNDLQGSPFNRFFLHNVTAKLTLESESKLYGDAKLCTQKYLNQENQTDIYLIGKGAEALIQLKDGSKVVAKLQAEEFETAYKNSPIQLDIYGDMALNVMKLVVRVAFVSTNVSTEGVFFPLSWYWQVNLNPFMNGGGATVDATAQDFKLLPGASLTVAKDVTLKAGKIAVYKQNSWTDAGVGASKYESNKGDAKLTVNGKLDAKELGGELQNGGNDAIVTVTDATSVVSKEVLSSTGNSFTGGSVTWDPISVSLGFVSGTADGVGTYTWNGTVWQKDA